MKISKHGTETIVKLNGENGNLENLKNIISELIKKGISGDHIKLISKVNGVWMNIPSNKNINELISKLCEKFALNVTIVRDGMNEDKEPFDYLTEVTNCYPDGSCKSTLMDWTEYLYRYNSGRFWDEHMEYLHDDEVKISIDDFKRDYPFVSEDDIQFIQEKFETLKD